jgi:hypothetical protein
MNNGRIRIELTPVLQMIRDVHQTSHHSSARGTRADDVAMAKIASDGPVTVHRQWLRYRRGEGGVGLGTRHQIRDTTGISTSNCPHIGRLFLPNGLSFLRKLRLVTQIIARAQQVESKIHAYYEYFTKSNVHGVMHLRGTNPSASLRCVSLIGSRI